MPDVSEYTKIILNFPENVTCIREAGVSGTELAKRLGVDRACSYNWEKGKGLPRSPLIFMIVHQWAVNIKTLSS